MLSRASMMMTSLETLKTSFALDIKLFEESVSRDIGTEGRSAAPTERGIQRTIQEASRSGRDNLSSGPGLWDAALALPRQGQDPSAAHPDRRSNKHSSCQ